MINNNNEFYQNSLINVRKDNDEWKNAAGTCSPELTEKSITENGTYTAASDNADGYSKVTVEVNNDFNTIEFYVPDRVDNTIRRFKTLIKTPIKGQAYISNMYITNYVIKSSVDKINLGNIYNGEIAFTPSENYIGFYNNGTLISTTGSTVTPNDGKLYVAYYSRADTPTGTKWSVAITKYENDFIFNIT